MTLPGDLSVVVVGGTYLDVAGDPMTGTISFSPCAPLMDATGQVVVTTEPVTCTLDGNGKFTSPPPVSTDSTTLLPAGWYYKVVAAVSGGTTRFSCFLPSSPSMVDITALTPLATLPQVTPYITGEGGTIGGLLTLAGSPGVRFPGGAPGDVLTSDVFGNGSWAPLPPSGVSSVNSQTGAVVLGAVDVGADAAGAASAAQSTAESFATSAVATETSRATTAEALKAPLASPALTGSPTAPTQTTGDNSMKIATDQFVTTAVATALPLAGGTMTGNIAMGSSHKVTGLAAGSASGDAAAFQQLPSAANLLAVGSGGTGSGTQNFADLTTNQTIGGVKSFTGTGAEVVVPTPVNPGDAATKAYVDASAAGLSIKLTVQESTTAALSPGNTYSNGSSGVGAALTATGNGTLTVDGQLVALNDRVLVKNEAAPANNGIYLCTTAGASGVPYVLTRTTDMDTAAQVPGAFTFVVNGTANAGNSYSVTAGGPYTIGTTAIVWTLFSTPIAISAGNPGISVTGSAVSLVTPVTIANGGTGNGSTVPQNDVFAGPGTSGAGAPSFRPLIAADVPTLNQSTTGSAASFTGSLAGDVTGTQSATTLAAITTNASYTNANITVDTKGRVTAASNGTGGGASLDTANADIAASPVAGATGAAGTGSLAAISTHAHPSPAAFAPLGLTGATQASRYVGSTTTGVPTSGTFVQGDFGISRSDGNLWVCLTGGLVGSGAVFTQIGGSSAAPLPVGQGGTSATNSAAAITNLGAADLSSAQTLTAKTLKNTSLTFVQLGTVTTSQSLSTGNGNVQELTLGASIAISAITGPGGSNACDLTLYIKQASSGGPFQINSWPGSVTWLGGGTAPTIQQAAGAVTVITFESLNGGTAWYGAQITGAPSLPLGVGLGGTGAQDANDALTALAGGGVLGIFGNGNDGAVTFDGTTPFTGFSTLSGTTYTLTRDVMATSVTLSGGATVRTSSGASGTYRIFCQGTVTIGAGCTITAAGNAAGTAPAAGAALSSGSLVGGRLGGTGGPAGTGTGANGGAATSAAIGSTGGTGGNGGGGGGSGSAGGTVSVAGTGVAANVLNTPFAMLTGMCSYGGDPLQIGFGAGGGAGGGATSNAGGGGGGGGGIVAIFAYSLVNNGTITVAGGAGARGAGGNAGGGGGGAGGLIFTCTLSSWPGTGTVITGGAGGALSGSGTAGAAGGTGFLATLVLTS